MKTGVFGGTFDPPHTGHLIVAQDAALALGLDRILFIPAALPPHKRNVQVTGAAVRARMLELAIAGDARFAVDRLELERAGASYTVDTLRQLTARDPAVEWTLLMGVDQYAEFGSWRDPAGIRGMARIAVLTRGGDGGVKTPAAPGGAAGNDGAGRAIAGETGPPAVELPGGDLQVEVTRIDISSTMVRRRVAAGLPIRYMVPAAVEQFIFDERLYRRNGAVLAG